MGQAAVETYFPCSIMMTDNDGSRRLTSAATEAPPAPPPTMTRFLLMTTSFKGFAEKISPWLQSFFPFVHSGKAFINIFNDSKKLVLRSDSKYFHSDQRKTNFS
jgi:hypothetical protein